MVRSPVTSTGSASSWPSALPASGLILVDLKVALANLAVSRYSGLFMCLSRPSMPVCRVERSTVNSTVPLSMFAGSIWMVPVTAEVRPEKFSNGASLVNCTRSLPPPPSSMNLTLSACATAGASRKRASRVLYMPHWNARSSRLRQAEPAPFEEDVRGDAQAGSRQEGGHDVERGHRLRNI